jgi:hypothetical protein
MMIGCKTGLTFMGDWSEKYNMWLGIWNCTVTGLHVRHENICLAGYNQWLIVKTKSEWSLITTEHKIKCMLEPESHYPLSLYRVLAIM